MANSRRKTIQYCNEMKHFFSASLIAVAVFVVWTRSTSTKQRQNSPAPATTTQQPKLRRAVGRHRCRDMPVAHCRPPRAACQPLEKSRLFKHWLFSMVGWLTEAPHHRTRARAHANARRCERQWFQLCLFYGMVLVVELDPLGRSWLSNFFFGEWENQQLWIVSHVMLPESNDCMLISFSVTSSTTSSTILLCTLECSSTYLYYSQSLRQKRWASFFQGP